MRQILLFLPPSFSFPFAAVGECAFTHCTTDLFHSVLVQLFFAFSFQAYHLSTCAHCSVGLARDTAKLFHFSPSFLMTELSD